MLRVYMWSSQTLSVQVFVVFMEVLCDIIHVYNAQLHGWLDTMLSNILCTAGQTAQKVTKLHESIQKTLDTMRWGCPGHTRQLVAIEMLAILS